MIPITNQSASTFIYGKISAVTGGSADPMTGVVKYYPTNTYYNIAAAIGSSIVMFKSQRPAYSLWRDDIELNPAQLLNINIVGCKHGDRIEWHFWEPPSVGECPTESERFQTLLAEQGVAVKLNGDAGSATPTVPSTPTPTPAPGES